MKFRGVMGAIIESILLMLANVPFRSRWWDTQRWKILRAAGVDIYPCEIRAPVDLWPRGALRAVSIGGDTFVNVGLRVAATADATVKIGRYCAIGPRVSFEATGHELVWSEANGWGEVSKPIVVEDKCWIGAGSTILSGVTIGEGAVVGAGSVVNRDVPPHTLVAGVPAKFIRDLS